MIRHRLACLLVVSGAVAASMAMAPQPLNGGEPQKIAQLEQPMPAPGPDEMHLGAYMWLEHIAPRHRR